MCNKIVWWICSINECGCHRYQAQICTRTGDGTRCPHNNLLAVYPDLCKEMKKNLKILLQGGYVQLINVDVIDKVNRRGCPYCVNIKLCEHNNLLAIHPDLCKEWDCERNVRGPETYPPGSDNMVWWICPINKCGCHKYQESNFKWFKLSILHQYVIMFT